MNAFNKIEEGNLKKCFREVSSKITGHVLNNEKTIEEKKLIAFFHSIMKTTGKVINQLHK